MATSVTNIMFTDNDEDFPWFALQFDALVTSMGHDTGVLFPIVAIFTAAYEYGELPQTEHIIRIVSS
eukprot:scaffold666953_cov60-Prasinocladus_malaysianus.AAC.1